MKTFLGEQIFLSSLLKHRYGHEKCFKTEDLSISFFSFNMYAFYIFFQVSQVWLHYNRIKLMHKAITTFKYKWFYSTLYVDITVQHEMLDMWIQPQSSGTQETTM